MKEKKDERERLKVNQKNDVQTWYSEIQLTRTGSEAGRIWTGFWKIQAVTRQLKFT